jgi:IS30 family transposase
MNGVDPEVRLTWVLEHLPDRKIKRIDEPTWAINSTLKKCLGFKTPAEAFIENINVALEM